MSVRYTAPALTAGLLLASMAAAGTWHGFDAAPPSAPRLIAGGELDALTVDLEVPGVVLTQDAEGWVHLDLPNQSMRMVAGEPELPLLTTSLMLPDTGNVEVDLEVLEEETLQLPGQIAPSHGHLTRDQAISTRPRVAGPVYQQGGQFPAADFQAELGNPYLMRDVRGVAVRVSPVVYDITNNTARVLKRARLHVTTDRSAPGVNTKRRTSRTLSDEFVPVYKRLFANADHLGMIDATDSAPGSGVILVPDKWVDAMQPLQEWRATKGMQSTLVPMSEVGETAEDIRSWVQSRYADDGFTHLLLVGDSDTMPTLKGENEGADCDACYGKLEGNDHVPDIFHSRFSATTTAEVDIQVARAVAYEKNPAVGEAGAFYLKGVGIASNEGRPPDYERMDIVRDGLMDWRFTAMDQLYDEKGWGGHRVSPDEVMDAVNEGRSIMGYLGHGSKKTWVTSKVGPSHIAAMDAPFGAWPMIWDVACVNGDFVGGSDSFAEAWAKAGTVEHPQGAIGIVAATTNMSWHPPVDWQREAILNSMVTGEAFTGGALHHLGLVKAMEKWGDDTDSEGVMMVEQCVFFGDSSVTLRSDLALAPEVSYDDGSDRATLTVTRDGAAVRGARVRFSAGDQSAVRISDGAGTVLLPEGMAIQSGLKITVTGPNLVPMIDETVGGEG